MPPGRQATQEVKVSKAVIIRGLQQLLEEKQREYGVLQQENATLRTKEEVLLQQVTQQGDNLHFVALAASQSEAGMPDMAKTLLQDLEVYELLQLLGRSSDKDKSGEEEPFTTQRLRAAVTPERVAAMRKTTVEEAAAHLKQLTMRMCMLLAGGPSKAHLFRDSIEAVVNEYGEYGLLLHVAVDWVALQIGTLNLDTLQVEEPPPGYWESVVDGLELEDQQAQTLAMGFNSYQRKSKPMIAALHNTVSSIRAILDADETSDRMQAQSPQECRSGAAEQPFWQFLHNTLDSTITSNKAAGAAAAAADKQANAVTSQQQQQQQESQQQQQQQTASSNPQPANQPQQQQQRDGDDDCLPQALHSSGSLSSMSSGGSFGVAKPWQQFGLSHGCLTTETGELLEQYMSELLQAVMKLREMHRTVTWLFLNTLNARQHALFITGSWPYWSRPLTMCQYIAEQHGHLLTPSQRQGSTSSGGAGATTTPSQHASATAVAEGVCHMHLGSSTPRTRPQVTPQVSHHNSSRGVTPAATTSLQLQRCHSQAVPSFV